MIQMVKRSSRLHLVAHGFSQRFGEDYDHVSASVVTKQTTLRVLLPIAVNRKKHIRYLNAKAAFLNGHLQQVIYMKQPTGLIVGGKEDHVCRLKKSVYELKQSARVWDEANRLLSFDINGKNLENM